MWRHNPKGGVAYPKSVTSDTNFGQLQAVSPFRPFDHVDHCTLRLRPFRTVFDCAGKEALDLHEVGNLGSNLLQMMRSDFPDFGTWRYARPSKSKNFPHLLGLEAESPCAAEKAERPHMPLVVNAVTARGSRRLGKHSDPLEVADRFGIYAGAPRELAAGEPCHDDFP